MAEGQNTEKPLEILVIDDNPLREAFADSIKLGIKRTGTYANADVAEDGLDGLAKFIERLNIGKPYDGILTDLGMPRVDGVTVVEIVKILSPQTPVVVLSGYEANELYKARLAKLKELKLDGFMQKPIGNPDIDYFLGWIIEARKNPKNPPEFRQPIKPRGIY
ncbi:response regulator [Candidatus Woesearchaeota archaeon]|nr:response regulator [Candidatus Woesearchaeota archaeon]